MTIIERIRGERRPVEFGRIAKDLMNRDMNALGRDASGVLDQVKDIRIAAADAIEHFQSLASDVAERAAERAGEAIEQVGDAFEHLGDDASKASKDVTIDVAKGKDDLAERIRKSLPTDRITKIVENLERDLPTTDKGRYDRAYSRGWARARTSFIVVGAAAGIAAGIAGAFLLDPKQGPRRRQALRTKVRTTTEGVSGQLSRTATLASDRARGFAIERGIIKPGDAEDADQDHRIGATAAPLIPVMDIPSSNGFGDAEPVMPLANGPISDPSSIEREPFDTPDGGLIGGVAAGEAETSEDPLAAGDEAERGTWHRTI